MNKNKMFTDREKQRWSLRKLTVGLSSVLLGMTLFGISGNAEAATPKVDLGQTETAKAAKPKQGGSEIAAPAAKGGDQSVQKQAAAPAKAQPAPAQSAKPAEAGKPANPASQKDQTPAQKTNVLNSNSVLSKGTKAVSGKVPAKTEPEQKPAKSSKPAADQAETDKAAGSKQANPKQAADQNKQPKTKQDINVKKLAKAAKNSNTAKELAESKQASSEPAADVNLWTTQTDSDGLELIGYNPITDDQKANIVLPNDQDFIKAGKLNQGQKVDISSSTVNSIIGTNKPKYFGISKTGGGKVVASDSNWGYAFRRYNSSIDPDYATVDGLDPNLTVMDLGNLDTHNITNTESFNFMFYKASKLTTIGDVSGWDTSHIVDLGSMFQDDYSLKNVEGIGSWDVSKVLSMNNMFQDDAALTNLDLSNWKTSSLLRINSVFKGDTSLQTLGNLGNWDVSHVYDVTDTFNGDSSLTYLGDLSNWDTSEFGDNSYISHGMQGMFQNCSSLKSIGNLDNWKLSKVISLKDTFSGDGSLQSLGDLSNWDIQNVQSLQGTFYGCSNLKDLGNIGKWDVSKVNNLTYTFYDCTNLTNIGDLSNWNTSNITDMYGAFAFDSKLANLGDLSNWQTGKVTNMQWLFYGDLALSGLGDLSNWNVGNVTNMNGMFFANRNLKKLDLSNWNTANITDMNAMFDGDYSLTDVGDLSRWNTASVKDTGSMFSATALEKLKINNWDLRQDRNFDSMFSSFRQPAIIYMNNVQLPNNSLITGDPNKQFNARDFSLFATHPLIVLSNVQQVQDLNKEVYDGYDNSGNRMSITGDNQVDYVKLSNNNSEYLLPIDFVYASESDLQSKLQQELSRENIKAELTQIYNDSTTSEAFKE